MISLCFSVYITFVKDLDQLLNTPQNFSCLLRELIYKIRNDNLLLDSPHACDNKFNILSICSIHWPCQKLINRRSPLNHNTRILFYGQQLVPPVPPHLNQLQTQLTHPSLRKVTQPLSILQIGSLLGQALFVASRAEKLVIAKLTAILIIGEVYFLILLEKTLR